MKAGSGRIKALISFASFSLAVLCGIHVEAAEPATVHPGTDLHLPDIKSSAGANIPSDYETRTPSKLSDNQNKRSLASISAQVELVSDHAQAIQTLAIKPALLGLPTAADVDLTRPASGVGVPRQFANLELDLDGVRYSLWVVDVTIDPRYQVRHVTAKILNVPGSWAIFTISADEKIIGTLATPDRSYRILPISGREQVAYRLQTDARRPALKDEPLKTRTADPTVQKLQQRHLQAVKISELQFEFVTVRQDGDKFAARGGRLGTFDSNRASNADLRKLIERLGALTNGAKYGDLQITERGNGFVKFKQVVNGIPVDARNEISVKANGQIDELRIEVVDPARAPTGNYITREQAMSRAVEVYSQRIVKGTTEVEFVGEDILVYELVPGQQHLQLVYRFGLRANGSSPVTARVNAFTRDVSLDPASVAFEFGQRIFVATSGAPQAGNEPGAVLAQGPDGVCVHASWCWTPEQLIMSATIAEVQTDWENSTNATDPNLCCERLGTDETNLDYVTHTNGSLTPAEYNRSTKSVLFRPFNPNDTFIPVRNADTIIHETAHHFLDVVGGLGTDDFSNVLNEGLADAMVGAIAEHRAPLVADPTYIDWLQQGQRWVIADGGYGPPNGIRDASQPKQLSWIASVLPNIANPDRYHLASLAISNFFYRLLQKGGITAPRLIELILKASTWISDWNSTPGLDVEDFYFAVDKSIRPNETTLRSHLQQVWTEMGGTVPSSGGPDNPPGGGGGGGSAPLALTAVNGSPLYCDRGIGFHSVGWTPMPNVGHYRTYVGPFEDIFPSYATSGYAWSNFNTEFRVKSCNGHGCSPASADNYVMNYTALCGTG